MKSLQHKYDLREELVISLQEERVYLLNHLDQYRSQAEVMAQVLQILDLQGPEKICEAIQSYKNRTERLERLLDSGNPKNGDTGEMLTSVPTSSFIKLNAVVDKVKRYFRLSHKTSLEELEYYITNLSL